MDTFLWNNEGHKDRPEEKLRDTSGLFSLGEAILLEGSRCEWEPHVLGQTHSMQSSFYTELTGNRSNHTTDSLFSYWDLIHFLKNMLFHFLHALRKISRHWIVGFVLFCLLVFLKYFSAVQWLFHYQKHKASSSHTVPSYGFNIFFLSWFLPYEVIIGIALLLWTHKWNMVSSDLPGKIIYPLNIF